MCMSFGTCPQVHENLQSDRLSRQVRAAPKVQWKMRAFLQEELWTDTYHLNRNSPGQRWSAHRLAQLSGGRSEWANSSIWAHGNSFIGHGCRCFQFTTRSVGHCTA